jgi:hypothetical protein
MATLAPHEAHVPTAVVTSMVNNSPSTPASMFPST